MPSLPTRDQVLGILTESVVRFFRGAGGEPAKVGAPAPLATADPRLLMLDHAALIEISGAQSGSLAFTTEHALAEALARRIGENAPDRAICADVTGEAANTIAGNARRELGASFLISVPAIISDQPDRLPLAKGTQVISIAWRGLRAYLVVCLGGAR